MSTQDTTQAVQVGPLALEEAIYWAEAADDNARRAQALEGAPEETVYVRRAAAYANVSRAQAAVAQVCLQAERLSRAASVDAGWEAVLTK